MNTLNLTCGSRLISLNCSQAEKYGKNISPGKQSPAGCRKSDPGKIHPFS